MITGTEHILTRAHWHWHHANEGCLQSCVTDILVSHKIEDNSGSLLTHCQWQVQEGVTVLSVKLLHCQLEGHGTCVTDIRVSYKVEDDP
jgi:virulence-associated protein VapD